MDSTRSLTSLFWPLLFCLLHLISAAADDDLMDFDFGDMKDVDWDYDRENLNSDLPTENNKNLLSMALDLDSFEDDTLANQVHPFDWREKVLRTALGKALTNKVLRQKFVEVMPILRVLTPQQRLTLSALISAQIGATKGQQLKLEQVRMMFGNDRKLLIPLVYDIANLVRNSASKYIEFDFNASPAAELLQQTPISRRRLDLSPEEEAEEEQNQEQDIGTIAVTADTSDATDSIIEPAEVFAELPDDLLDPQSINEALQGDDESKPTTINISRAKRAAESAATEFVHKLVRAVPLSVNEDDLLRGAAGRTVKLNTTSFVQPDVSNTNEKESNTTVAPSSTEIPAYHSVEDLAFADLNGTEVTLTEAEANLSKENEEPLPNPEELIAGPRYHVGGNKKLLYLRSKPGAAAKRKRGQLRQRINAPTPVAAASPKKCERFTASMCIRTDDYPLEQIMGSIRRHRNAMSALLAEYHDKTAHFDASEDASEFYFTKKRREDDATGGGMCQSIVRYARPQKARSAAGEWKYIVNTGQHTQTLRLEKCTNPQESCSYLAQSYRSHCSQVYNYHRLLSWDKSRGLHVDIFKVPTCCSCHVDGYRQEFPPLASIKANQHSQTPAYKSDVYSTINEDIDYEEEDDEEDDFNSQYSSSNFAKHKPGQFEHNELLLGSKNVRNKVYPASPTVGAYLTPPGSDEYDTKYVYRNQRISSPPPPVPQHNLLSHSSHRRPHQSYGSLNGIHEPSLDLDFAPSETHTDKEVNLIGSEKKRVQQKRKRIYSVPHTATTAAVTASTVAASASSSSSSPSTRGSSNTAIATTAHQSPGFSYYSPSLKNSHSDISSGSSSSNSGGFKSISRFHSSHSSLASHGQHKTIPATEAPSSPTSTSTSTTHRYQSSSPIPPLYHVNSIYSVKFNASNTSHGSASVPPKRINYSYHPIIDFFEKNKPQSTLDSSDSSIILSTSTKSYPIRHTTTSTSLQEQQLYPYKISKTSMRGGSVYHSRERRIGFGAGAGGVLSEESDNVWHPVVVAS